MFKRAFVFSSMALLVSSYLTNHVSIKKSLLKSSLNEINPTNTRERFAFQAFETINSISKIALLGSGILMGFNKVAFAEDPAETTTASTDSFITTSSGLMYTDEKVSIYMIYLTIYIRNDWLLIILLHDAGWYWSSSFTR